MVNGLPVGNKAITTEQRAQELYHVYGDGISLKPTSAFYVAPKTGLIATVSPGFGLMSGYHFWMEAALDITMNSSTSDQTLYIGVRIDIPNGEYTGNDVIARTTFVPATDRVFAIIVIPANAVTLTAAMITDTRSNPTYCGTIDSQRLALTDIYNEYRDALIVLQSTGIPSHHATHEPGGSDPLPFVAYSASQSLSDAQKLQALKNISAVPISASTVNLIINSNFNINQDNLTGTVTLAANAFAHDGWRAGASGCTYTFAKAENRTTLTITAGSLRQNVDGNDLKSGKVCLSWGGTAQGRIGTSGAYAASPVVGDAVGGTNLAVEFSTGTLHSVQLVYGEMPLTYAPLDAQEDLSRCRERYIKDIGDACHGFVNNTLASIFIPLPQTMRSSITISDVTLTNADSISYGSSTKAISSIAEVLPRANGIRIGLNLASTVSGLFPCSTINTQLKIDKRI